MFTPLLKEELKRTLDLAWPIVGAQLLTMAMIFTDNLMVARLGEVPLAALGMAGSFYSTLIILTMGVLSSLSPLVSHAFGAGRTEEVGHWMRQGFRLSVGLGAVMAGILWNAEPLFLFLGQVPEVAALAQTYLSAAAWGLPPWALFFCARTLCEGTGDSRPSIWMAALGALANIPLNTLFMFGVGSWPGLGIAGTGYATALVNLCMGAALLFYLYRRQRYSAYGLFQRDRLFDGARIREMFRMGLPISGGMLAEMGFFASATLLMGTLGARELATHQIAINAASVVFMIPLGLSLAVSVRVGQARGRGDSGGLLRSARAGLLLTVAIQVVSGGIFLLFPQGITALYTSDPALAVPAQVLLRIGGLFQLFDGLQVVGIAILRGLRDTKVPFVNTLISFWIIGAPAALWGVGRFGPPGIWWSMVLGLGVAAVLHLIRFRRLSVALVE